ncbi:MAG: hypothetical protein Q8R00_04380 [Candidatus Nanoarchaeia archaeon]|nr:hypothetical protein [Candidatus Nanoarchaeia archaeon]
MIVTVDKITEDLLREFGDRKQKGRLDLVYNRNTRQFIAVPKYMEHKDFMPDLGTDYESLVPIQLRMDVEGGKKRVNRIIVGVSSFEETQGIKHPLPYIIEAYSQTITRLLNTEDIEASMHSFEYSKRHTIN